MFAKFVCLLALAAVTSAAVIDCGCGQPQNIGGARVISDSCSCVKTVVRPQLSQRIVEIPTTRKQVQTIVRPVIENVNYQKSLPVADYPDFQIPSSYIPSVESSAPCTSIVETPASYGQYFENVSPFAPTLDIVPSSAVLPSPCAPSIYNAPSLGFDLVSAYPAAPSPCGDISAPWVDNAASCSPGPVVLPSASVVDIPSPSAQFLEIPSATASCGYGWSGADVSSSLSNVDLRPRVISDTCSCVKTVVRPTLNRQVVNVPAIRKEVRTSVKPVVETINYERPGPVSNSYSNQVVEAVPSAFNGFGDLNGYEQIVIPNNQIFSSCGQIASPRGPVVSPCNPGCVSTY